MSIASPRRHDIILVGAGLANGLLAHWLLHRRPTLDLLVLEQAESVGAAHTWCFHEADLTPAQNRVLAPFVAFSWPGYEVRFPSLTRTLALTYCCLTAESFRSALVARLGDRLRCGVAVAELGAGHVRLASGETLLAGAVVDGRGFQATAHMVNRFQSFLGQELRLHAPHGLECPILMDATVEQHGSYRFVYVLPTGPDTLLIEDTYYADTAALDPALLRARIAAYADSKCWRIATIVREESGVLPVTLSGNLRRFWRALPTDYATVGVRAGLFHPTTGYSLPDAARLAEQLADCAEISSAQLRGVAERYAARQWAAGRVFRLVNRMLFLAGPPERRYRVLRRFYTLRVRLIGRFYAGALRPLDKLRLLCGRPPVPLASAIRAALASGR